MEFRVSGPGPGKESDPEAEKGRSSGAFWRLGRRRRWEERRCRGAEMPPLHGGEDAAVEGRPAWSEDPLQRLRRQV